MTQPALFPDTDIVGTGRLLGDWPIQRPGTLPAEPAHIRPLQDEQLPLPDAA